MALNLKKLKESIPFFRTGGDVIGIDFGQSSIKIAQIKVTGGSASVVKCGIIANPSAVKLSAEEAPEDVAAVNKLVKDYLSSEGIKSKFASSSVAGNSVIVRNVKLPKMRTEELAKSLRFEAEEFIPFDVSDIYLAAKPVRDIEEEGQPKTESVIVAAKREIVDQRIERLKAVGLTPVVIDVDIFCVTNLLEYCQPTFNEENAVVINLGAKLSSLSILEHGTTRIVRDIPFGGNLLTNALVNAFGTDFSQAEALKKQYGLVPSVELEKMTDAETAEQITSTLMQSVDEHLLPEIQRSIDFFNTISSAGEEVKKIILSGGGALLKNLDKYLGKQFDMDVVVFNPFEFLEHNIPAEMIELGPAFCIALGLALRKGGDMDAVRAE